MTRRRDYYGGAHDERVDPHSNLTPSMPDPDWGNVIVQPNQKRMPVGDPTLWANTITTEIDADPILGDTPRVIAGNQIILAQAQDRYSRSWSLSGVVTLPQAAWNAAAGANPPSFPNAGTANRFEVWLSVVQGIEKIFLEHLILLMAGGFAPAYGLCNTQASRFGGPYGATFTSDLPEEGQQSRSFAAIGALIGNTISARAIYVRGSGGQINDATVTLLLTPYAPGAGL